MLMISIVLDGHDIASLNLQWLRQQVAIVTQQPTLFATTVFENIRFGLIGTEHESSSHAVVEMLVLDAAKKANCLEFIAVLHRLCGYRRRRIQRRRYFLLCT